MVAATSHPPNTRQNWRVVSREIEADSRQNGSARGGGHAMTRERAEWLAGLKVGDEVALVTATREWSIGRVSHASGQAFVEVAEAFRARLHERTALQ